VCPPPRHERDQAIPIEVPIDPTSLLAARSGAASVVGIVLVPNEKRDSG
jgi:hypothetical protein